MLVLSRKKGETIIAGDIVFRVVDVRGDKVRIGIEAPDDIKILRGELADAADTGQPNQTNSAETQTQT